MFVVFVLLIVNSRFEVILKFYFSIFLYSVFCFTHAYGHYKNSLDTSKTQFINSPNAEILSTSEPMNQNVLETIGNTYGYLAFYKTGPTEFLGNFAECPHGLYYQGFYFRNSEAAFQWTKFQLAAEHHQNLDMMSDPEMEKFFEANGEEAFQLRKKFDQKYKSIFPKNWHKGLRDQVMWQILQAKFQQNPDFAKILFLPLNPYICWNIMKRREETPIGQMILLAMDLICLEKCLWPFAMATHAPFRMMTQIVLNAFTMPRILIVKIPTTYIRLMMFFI